MSIASINNLAVTNNVQTQSTQTPSDNQLQQTIELSLLADYDSQLSSIAKGMQDTLSKKKTVSDQMAQLQNFLNRQMTTLLGEDFVTLTSDEVQKAKANFPDLKISGGNQVSKTNLENVLSGKQQELAGLNSNSEMTSLQIQSVVDQRKQALTLLTNLMASNSDTLMTIIRNLKN